MVTDVEATDQDMFDELDIAGRGNSVHVPRTKFGTRDIDCIDVVEDLYSFLVDELVDEENSSVVTSPVA